MFNCLDDCGWLHMPHIKKNVPCIKNNIKNKTVWCCICIFKHQFGNIIMFKTFKIEHKINSKVLLIILGRTGKLTH